MLHIRIIHARITRDVWHVSTIRAPQTNVSCHTYKTVMSPLMPQPQVLFSHIMHALRPKKIQKNKGGDIMYAARPLKTKEGKKRGEGNV